LRITQIKFAFTLCW